MLSKYKNELFGMMGIMLVAGLMFAVNVIASNFIASGISAKVKTEDTGYMQSYTFLNATTSLFATSTNVIDPNSVGYFRIAGAKKVDFYFQRGGLIAANTGTTTFSVQVTPDGVNWFDTARLIPATTTTNVSSATYQSTVGSGGQNGESTSTKLFDFDLSKGNFLGVRCIAKNVVDGEATCKATAEF